jgi:hypothetical protein
VILSAEVRDEFNQTVPNQVIGFYIKGPNQTDVGYLVRATNSSGIASLTIGLPPFVGTFEVYARTGFSDTVLLDAVTFEAKPT